jgi:hypothetical protein
MNIQRMKFAHARGARIQCKNYRRAWVNLAHPGWFDDTVYRIHPADAHLEYGPLSTALREHVIYGATEPGWPLLDDLCSVTFWWREVLGDVNDGMFVLFVAELLADEGM